MNIESKIWITPNNEKVSFIEKGRYVSLNPLKIIPKLDADTLFKKTDYLSKTLHNITKNIDLSFALSGIIGIGKSTIPKVMQLYMDAEEYYEETNNMPLQLLYHDMGTYSFPFQFYVGERRQALNRSARRSLNSAIIDRSFYEDLIFTLNFLKMGSMSLIQQEYVKDMMKEMIKETSHPDVLLWLQGKPETAFKRLQKRGIEYEAEGKERPLTKKELKEIKHIKNYFIHLVEKYAPDEVRTYNQKQKIAGIPLTMKPGGITLNYLKNLHKNYNNYFEDVLKMLEFDGTLIKLNVDDEEGIDKRVDYNYQVAMMDKIKNGVLLSLHRKGYSINKIANRKKIEIISPYDNKKPYLDKK